MVRTFLAANSHKRHRSNHRAPPLGQPPSTRGFQFVSWKQRTFRACQRDLVAVPRLGQPPTSSSLAVIRHVPPAPQPPYSNVDAQRAPVCGASAESIRFPILVSVGSGKMPAQEVGSIALRGCCRNSHGTTARSSPSGWTARLRKTSAAKKRRWKARRW